MEHNGKMYHWCKICNFGRGKWVDHKEEACPYRRKQTSHETGTDSDDAGLMVMDLAECGFLAVNILWLLSRTLLDTYNTTGDIFCFCMEVCVHLIALCMLICSPRRREPGVTCAHNFGPKGERKRLNLITLLAYPRSYMIFTELMWSMYSVAMILCCALSCLKPPDLVSEGG